MKYLYIMEDGSTSQTDKEPSSEDCRCVDEGTLIIIKYELGTFELAEVSSAYIPDDEDEEAGDSHEEWSITSWAAA